MRQLTPKLAAVAALSVLALAACSDDEPESTAATTPPTEATTTTGAPSQTTTALPDADVQVGETSLGDTAVDSAGMTLYQFANDSATSSACNEDCATLWPPVTPTGDEATRGTGISGTFTTITRADGTKQAVLAGHPLYTFSGDEATGDIAGQGLGGVWYVTATDGTAIKGAS